MHHINEEGDDAGVVYCEMQDCENTAENRTRLAFVRNMYPGRCGYKSETGGNVVVKQVAARMDRLLTHSKFITCLLWFCFLACLCDKDRLIVFIRRCVEELAREYIA